MEEHLRSLQCDKLPVTQIYQEDTETVHFAKVAQDRIMQSGGRIIKWIACSTDLSRIENQWGVLTCAVNGDNRQFVPISIFLECIPWIWNTICDHLIENRIKSMHSRCLTKYRGTGAKSTTELARRQWYKEMKVSVLWNLTLFKGNLRWPTWYVINCN